MLNSPAKFQRVTMTTECVKTRKSQHVVCLKHFQLPSMKFQEADFFHVPVPSNVIVHTRAHTRTHAHTHTRPSTRTHTHTHARLHARMHTHKHTHTHTQTHTHTNTYTHKHTHTHTHKHTHTHTHTRARASTHTHSAHCIPKWVCEQVSSKKGNWNVEHLCRLAWVTTHNLQVYYKKKLNTNLWRTH